MKRLLSVILCTTVLFSLTAVGAVMPAEAADGVDFLRESSLSCAGATANLQNGVLTITATAADQEVGLVVSEAADLTSYPIWQGTVESTVPFDIVFYDKNHAKWIYAAANFCHEFENNNGASHPLPAGYHQVSFSITGAYTWNGDALPTDAAINSIIFILRAPGTIKVERCAMTNGNAFTAAYPDTVYQTDNALIKAIPHNTTIDVFCKNVRRQFDTVKTVVKKNGKTATASEYIGTGDLVTLNSGERTVSYTAVVRGDLDASGTISTTDARCLLIYCLKSSQFSEAQTAAADMLTDNVINTKDARQLIQESLSPPSMQYTQEQVVESDTFTGETKYTSFLTSAQRDTMIAGLKQHLVPQGLAQSHKTNLLYMSAYASDGGNSAILVYNPDGHLCAEYVIYNADGSPCTNHLGGIAVTDTTLFVSYDSNTAYRVAAIPLGSLVTRGTQKVFLSTTYEVPVATSFLSYYDGYLWMGNFYLPSGGYDLMRILNYTTTVNGEAYGCYIAGYDISKLGADRLSPANNQTYATPDVMMAAPQKVQGMTFDTQTHTVILSHSWGRKNDSSLAFYTVDIQKKADTTITLNNTEIPCFLLADSAKQVKTLPMAEGITLGGDGTVRVLYESGANKYSDGLHRTDYIWQYTY